MKSKQQYEARAGVAKALAHPSRLLLLDLLQQREMCVADLTEAVGADQSTVSKHLAILKSAGLIDHRKAGTANYYRVTCDCLEGFFNCMEAVVQLEFERESRPSHEQYDDGACRMKRVLILCTGNSCRSQMAEALWAALGGGAWESVSAGSKPAGYVHPLAVRAMREIGIDLSRHTSKSLDQFRDQAFDLVVTVCDNAREACPVFPHAGRTLHWPFDDPAHAAGSEEEQMAMFRRVREEIRDRIAGYLLQSASTDVADETH